MEVRHSQKMVDLPQHKLEPSSLITDAAGDSFGPIYITEGRKELEKMGCIPHTWCEEQSTLREQAARIPSHLLVPTTAFS